MKKNITIKEVAKLSGYSTQTISRVINKDLKVMDSTATSLCRDNNIPLLVFGINEPENILKNNRRMWL